MAGVNNFSEHHALGLIAGNGTFPLLILKEARRRRIPVVTIAIREEADPGIQDLATPLHWVRVGELGRAVRILRQAGICRAIMAGQVQHKQIFRALRPDPLLLKVLSRLRARNPDAILKTVADVLSEEGIELMDSTTLLTSLLSARGVMGAHRPSAEESKDIDFGYRMAKEVARLDIGQTVVVKSAAVVSVEAMEGTDETIRRAGRTVPSSRGGLVVVKVARPSQDMRFDVPVVGLRTVEVMKEAGATVMAVEAGRCLLLEKDQLIQSADRAEIAVVGVTSREGEEPGDS